MFYHKLDKELLLYNLIQFEKYEPDLGVLVDLGFVGDVFGTVGVAEGGQGLLVVVVRRGQARNHHRLRVTAQRVLKTKQNKLKIIYKLL